MKIKNATIDVTHFLMGPITHETPALNKNRVTFLVNTRVSDTCVDDSLLTGVRGILTNYERLKISQKIVGAGRDSVAPLN